MHYFCDDGCLYEVPDELLLEFGMQFGMIDAYHLDNMRQLLNPAMLGKRHLNGIQPFGKVVWVQPWRRSKETFIHHRPRPATAPDFYSRFIEKLNAEGNGPKSEIKDKQKQTFGKFLNRTYYPAGNANPPADHYREWELALVSLEEAKRLLECCPPAQWQQVCERFNRNERVLRAACCPACAPARCVRPWLIAVPLSVQSTTAGVADGVGATARVRQGG